MSYLEDPISSLAACIAHAQYEGFSNIQYEGYTGVTFRRPTTRDFIVYTMFPQTWGSTALGHGGMGGAAVTDAYTVVLYCTQLQEHLVYFGGQFCYKIQGSSVNLSLFLEDCKNHCLVSKHESKKYQ